MKSVLLVALCAVLGLASFHSASGQLYPWEILPNTDTLTVNWFDTLSQMVAGRRVSVNGVCKDVSPGSYFVVGVTSHSFRGHTVADEHNDAHVVDGFVMKYSSTGKMTWSSFPSTNMRDAAVACTVDSLGNLYVTGGTGLNLNGGGEFAGSVNSDFYDAFLLKYDSSLDLQWTRVVGSPNYDFSTAVTVDGNGDIYIYGTTQGNMNLNLGTDLGSDDVFLVKYNANGDRLWGKQFGSQSSDSNNHCAVNSHAMCFTNYGNTADERYHVGSTAVGLPDGGVVVAYSAYATPVGTSFPVYYYDVYLERFDIDGNRLWVSNIYGESYQTVTGLVVDDAGSIFVTGRTDGSGYGQEALSRSVYVSKFSADGEMKWFRIIANGSLQFAGPIAVDKFGGVYAAFMSYDGALDGLPDKSQYEFYTDRRQTYLTKFDADTGMREWSKLFVASILPYCTQGQTSNSVYNPQVNINDIAVSDDASEVVLVGMYNGWFLTESPTVPDDSTCAFSHWINYQGFVLNMKQKVQCDVSQFDQIMDDLSVLHANL